LFNEKSGKFNFIQIYFDMVTMVMNISMREWYHQDIQISYVRIYINVSIYNSFEGPREHLEVIKKFFLLIAFGPE